MILGHSTVTKKGQTTIPNEIRDTLKIKPGDRLEYRVAGGEVTIRVHPGAASLAGIFADVAHKGRNMSFHQIREAAREKTVKAMRKRK